MIHLLLITALQTASLQPVTDTVPARLQRINSTVTTINHTQYRGVIYDINDSSLQVADRAMLRNGTPSVQTYNYTTIGEVTLKRRNSVARGALFGTLAGAGFGVLLGLIEGDDKVDPNAWFQITFTAGEKAALYGVGFGTMGAVAGMLIGLLARKRFVIGGNREKFQQLKMNVLQRANKTPLQ